MKKILLTLGGLLAFSFGAQSQLRGLDYIKEALIPEHIQLQMQEEAEGLMALSYSMNKNNSFDTPLAIEHYSVDLLQIETLEKNYAFTYSPAGELRTMTRMDATFNNERKWTYNFNSYGQYSSVIQEEWNGMSWTYTSRVIFDYTGSGLLKMQTYEDYVGWDWVYDGGIRIEYVGGESTPSQVIGATSDDGILWQDELKMNYQYTNGVPSFLEMISFDNNYLIWVQGEKWEITDWGPEPFYPDFFFNAREGQNKITDNLISKRNPTFYYPAQFDYFSDFNYATGVYDIHAKVESTYDLGNRIELLVQEYNGATLDSTYRYTSVYDVCYGFRSSLSEEYVSPGVWTITDGVEFLGYTTSYSGSCFVFAYNYFENFSDAEPSGIRTRRYAITQASELNTEQLDQNAFEIYPNPATSTLQISMDAPAFDISIVSMDGRTVLGEQNVISDQPIDIVSIPSGVYLIMVTADGESTVEKFIKE